MIRDNKKIKSLVFLTRKRRSGRVGLGIQIQRE